MNGAIVPPDTRGINATIHPHGLDRKSQSSCPGMIDAAVENTAPPADAGHATYNNALVAPLNPGPFATTAFDPAQPKFVLSQGRLNPPAEPLTRSVPGDAMLPSA